MEPNYYLIKSNSLAHLFELKNNKTIETSNLFKSSLDINLYNNKILKPKKINVFVKSRTKNEYIKIFADSKLREAINSEIPKNENKLIDKKEYKTRNLRNKFFKGNLISSFSDKNFDRKNIFYNNGNNQDFILPKIIQNDSYFKNKETNITKNNEDKLKLTMDTNDNEKYFRMNSGLMNSKRLYLQRFNKLKINSMNNSFKNKDFIDDEKNAKTLINLRKEYNSRNILNNKLKENKILLKRYTKPTILGYLNEKYSSINFSNNSINKYNFKDSSKFDTNKRDEYLSISISRRYHNLVSKIKKNNSKIYNFNNKININILFSKVGKKLERNKIIYDINKALSMDKKINLHLKELKKC